MKGLLKKFEKLPLAFGGASISGNEGGYGFGDMSFDESQNVLQCAYDLGVRIFDSAPIYGFGESEKRIGKFIANKREDVFVITKSGVTWHENKRVDMTNAPESARKMLEQSLRDLNSEYIDLYMVHWPDEKVDIRRTLEVYHKAKEQGKIKHIGLCNTHLEDLKKAAEIDKVEVVQSQYNFFEKPSEEVLNYLKEHEISFMSWGTLDKGILTGSVKLDRQFDKSDCRSWAPWWKQSNKDQKINLMQEKILPYLEERGHSGLEFALGFNLAYGEVDSLVCGGKTSRHWEGMVKALSHLPSLEVIDECLKMKDF